MIVEKFNGMIGFESVYDKGTTFYFEFEVIEYDEDLEAIEEATKSNEIESIVASKKRSHMPEMKFIDAYIKLNSIKDKRILVVDDEEFCISAMEIILKMSGVDIAT